MCFFCLQKSERISSTRLLAHAWPSQTNVHVKGDPSFGHHHENPHWQWTILPNSKKFHLAFLLLFVGKCSIFPLDFSLTKVRHHLVIIGRTPGPGGGRGAEDVLLTASQSNLWSATFLKKNFQKVNNWYMFSFEKHAVCRVGNCSLKIGEISFYVEICFQSRGDVLHGLLHTYYCIAIMLGIAS